MNCDRCGATFTIQSLRITFGKVPTNYLLTIPLEDPLSPIGRAFIDPESRIKNRRVEGLVQ